MCDSRSCNLEDFLKLRFPPFYIKEMELPRLCMKSFFFLQAAYVVFCKAVRFVIIVLVVSASLSDFP